MADRACSVRQGVQAYATFEGVPMRQFSFGPTLKLKGRKSKGLRSWAGKPFHPPLTDFPVTCYVLGAIFDTVAVIGRTNNWAIEWYHAATFVFIAGAIVSVFAALT